MGLQAFAGYLGQGVQIASYGKVSISVFQEFFARIEKFFALGGRLGTSL